MRKNFTYLALTLLILINSNLTAQAYYFATDIETQITKLDDAGCELVVLEHDDEDEQEVYPVGTILKGKFFEYNFRRRLMRDEYVKIHFYEAVLPDGSVEPMDNDLKVRPRVLVSARHSLQLAGAAVGTALKITVAVWSVGFPVGRGVKAITDAAYSVYNTPVKESKWKQGSKGFVKGLLFPLPEIFMKGEELAIHDESFLWIQDTKEDKKDLTAFVVKKKNIYLSRDKYYTAKGEEAPDFTQYLDSEDLKKYQEKLAKKGVSAKVRETKKQEIEVKEEKENLVKKEQDEKLLEQKLTIEPHVHLWERAWRKPKVTFEKAQ